MNTRLSYRSRCKDCAYAVKHYSGIGNAVIFTHVSACMFDTNCKNVKQFKEKKQCENYFKAKMPFPKGKMGQQLFHLYRRLEEINEILFDIIDTLIPNADDELDSCQQEPTE